MRFKKKKKKSKRKKTSTLLWDLLSPALSKAKDILISVPTFADRLLPSTHSARRHVCAEQDATKALRDHHVERRAQNDICGVLQASHGVENQPRRKQIQPHVQPSSTRSRLWIITTTRSTFVAPCFAPSQQKATGTFSSLPSR